MSCRTHPGVLGFALAFLFVWAGNRCLAAITRNLGVDVSHFQGSTGISQSSWNQMYNADGKRFTYVKASEGLTGPDDAAMANNVTRATAAGLLVGVYHYAHPENRTNTAGAVQEAGHFLSYAGTNIGPGRLRPVLDIEGSANTLSVSGLTDWIIAFSNEIMAQRGNGAAPILYMNRSFARDEVDSRLANYDLWLAYYTNADVSTGSPPPTSSYPNPLGVFNNWAFWQYSSTGTSGGISPIDLDVCHEEYKPLTSFIIPSPAPFVISNPSIGPSAFRLSFSNVAGTHFTVISSTNVLQPASGWTVLGPATEAVAGIFQFTDVNAPSKPAMYYRVVSP